MEVAQALTVANLFRSEDERRVKARGEPASGSLSLVAGSVLPAISVTKAVGYGELRHEPLGVVIRTIGQTANLNIEDNEVRILDLGSGDGVLLISLALQMQSVKALGFELVKERVAAAVDAIHKLAGANTQAVKSAAGERGIVITEEEATQIAEACNNAAKRVQLVAQDFTAADAVERASDHAPHVVVANDYLYAREEPCAAARNNIIQRCVEKGRAAIIITTFGRFTCPEMGVHLGARRGAKATPLNGAVETPMLVGKFGWRAAAFQGVLSRSETGHAYAAYRAHMTLGARSPEDDTTVTMSLESCASSSSFGELATPLANAGVTLTDLTNVFASIDEAVDQALRLVDRAAGSARPPTTEPASAIARAEPRDSFAHAVVHAMQACTADGSKFAVVQSLSLSLRCTLIVVSRTAGMRRMRLNTECPLVRAEALAGLTGTPPPLPFPDADALACAITEPFIAGSISAPSRVGAPGLMPIVVVAPAPRTGEDESPLARRLRAYAELLGDTRVEICLEHADNANVGVLVRSLMGQSACEEFKVMPTMSSAANARECDVQSPALDGTVESAWRFVMTVLHTLSPARGASLPTRGVQCYVHAAGCVALLASCLTDTEPYQCNCADCTAFREQYKEHALPELLELAALGAGAPPALANMSGIASAVWPWVITAASVGGLRALAEAVATRLVPDAVAATSGIAAMTAAVPAATHADVTSSATGAARGSGSGDKKAYLAGRKRQVRTTHEPDLKARKGPRRVPEAGATSAGRAVDVLERQLVAHAFGPSAHGLGATTVQPAASEPAAVPAATHADASSSAAGAVRGSPTCDVAAGSTAHMQQTHEPASGSAAASGTRSGEAHVRVTIRQLQVLKGRISIECWDNRELCLQAVPGQARALSQLQFFGQGEGIKQAFEAALAQQTTTTLEREPCYGKLSYDIVEGTMEITPCNCKRGITVLSRRS